MKRVIIVLLVVNAALPGTRVWQELPVARSDEGAPSGNGDVNCDGQVNIADAVGILTCLFAGGEAPSTFADPGELEGRVTVLDQKVAQLEEANGLADGLNNWLGELQALGEEGDIRNVTLYTKASFALSRGEEMELVPFLADSVALNLQDLERVVTDGGISEAFDLYIEHLEHLPGNDGNGTIDIVLSAGALNNRKLRTFFSGGMYLCSTGLVYEKPPR